MSRNNLVGDFMNNILAKIDKNNVIKGELNVGLHIQSAYEIAVSNGYIGTFQEWIVESLSPIIADFYLNDNGELNVVYNLDKYNFSIDDYGNLIITIK